MWYALFDRQCQQALSVTVAASHTLHALFDAGLKPPWVPDALCNWVPDLLAPLLGPAVGSPRFSIDVVRIGARSAPVTEAVAIETPFCRLLHFSRKRTRAAARKDRAILLCAPLAGHAAVMMRETVETLIEDGDVYITDWVNAREVPLAAGPFGMDEYVLMLDGFIEHAMRASRSLHMIAVCQAAVPALGVVALRASRQHVLPCSLTLMGGPIDTRLNPSALGRFAAVHSTEWFRYNAFDVVPAGYPGAGRRVFPAYIQQTVVATISPQHYLDLVARYAATLASFDGAAFERAQRSLREYSAFLDMPAEYFVDMLEIVFHEARLACSTWAVRGDPVRPQDLKNLPLLTVEGEKDGVTGVGQTHAAHLLCSGIDAEQRKRLDVKDCDHYGLFTGTHWREEIHREIRSFLARHDTPRESAERSTHRQPVGTRSRPVPATSPTTGSRNTRRAETPDDMT